MSAKLFVLTLLFRGNSHILLLYKNVDDIPFLKEFKILVGGSINAKIYVRMNLSINKEGKKKRF